MKHLADQGAVRSLAVVVGMFAIALLVAALIDVVAWSHMFMLLIAVVVGAVTGVLLVRVIQSGRGRSGQQE